MNDKTKTPGAMVLFPRSLPTSLVNDVYMKWAGRADTLWPDLLEAAEKAGLATDHIEDTRAMVEQTPAVGDDLDDTLRDLASSACQEALSNGVGEEAFLRLARTVRHRVDAPLKAEIARLDAELDDRADWDQKQIHVIHQLNYRVAELEAHIAKAHDWQHLKPDMDLPKP